MKIHCFIILILGIAASSCTKKSEENTPITTACFTTNKDVYDINETVTVTNCSENATTYTWEIYYGSILVYTYPTVSTNLFIPISSIPGAAVGTYTVKLIAKGNTTASTTKIISIISSNPGTKNPGPYTKLYINKIEILDFPLYKPNSDSWDSDGIFNNYPDMFIKIYRQTTSGVLEFFDNYSDAFEDRTSTLLWDYSSNPKLISIPSNEGFMLNISLCDDDGFSYAYNTMSQILNIDLCSAANYNKPTLTFTQGEFSVKFNLQWAN